VGSLGSRFRSLPTACPCGPLPRPWPFRKGISFTPGRSPGQPCPDLGESGVPFCPPLSASEDAPRSGGAPVSVGRNCGSLLPQHCLSRLLPSALAQIPSPCLRSSPPARRTCCPQVFRVTDLSPTRVRGFSDKG
jgi:hypothetical protein